MVKTTTFAKWGNSIGIRVPDIFIETLQVSPGDTARVRFVDGEIRITTQKKKLSIQERIARITPDNCNIDRIWLDSQPIGNEIWHYEK